MESGVVVGIQPDVSRHLGSADPAPGLLHQQPRDQVLGLAGDVRPVRLWEHEVTLLEKYISEYKFRLIVFLP